MIKFLDTTATIPFSVSTDTEETKSVFHISPLTSQQLQVINDATMQLTNNNGMQNISMKHSLRIRLAVQFGLRGWENTGKEFVATPGSVLGIPVDRMISDQLLNQLPIDYVNEIGEEIQRISVSSGIDAKN